MQFKVTTNLIKRKFIDIGSYETESDETGLRNPNNLFA